MYQYDLVVAYRVCPFVSKTCGLYDEKDKFDLFKLCLRSFANAINGIKVKIIAILDTCPPEYEKLFKEYFLDDDLEIIKLNNAGNEGTFEKQIDILSTQNYSEKVYFAEDDYFYLKDSFSFMLELINKENIHFITPYDQPDYYHIYLHKHLHKSLTNKNVVWRTVASTTLTFMTSKSVLIQTQENFRSFKNKHKDTIIWLRLTKYKILNPFNYMIFIILAIICRINNKIFKTNCQQSRPGLKHLFNVYFQRNGFKLLLNNKTYTLWSPYKSLATHMAYKYLSYNVNWEDKINLLAKELSVKIVDIDDEWNGFK